MGSIPSRRDFLRLGGLSLAGLAFRGFTPGLITFDGSDVVRVATKSWSVYSSASLDSAITATWYRDDLIHVYEQVTALPATPEPDKTPTPNPNPVWYRVWGGYMWRARVQPVQTLFNVPLSRLPSAAIPAGQGILAEVTVPFSDPWRYTKAFGWENLWTPGSEWRLYFQSVHWVDSIESGPPVPWYDGPWYRIWDHIASFPYYVPAMHLRPIPADSYAPISADVPPDAKRIDVNLTKQTLTAYENDKAVFSTKISSGIPSPETNTHVGEFAVIEKLPSEHMGVANVFGAVDDYVLAGVPWTSYFTEDGIAFHGTYWHQNFGTPMSHGCINMRIEEALWIFRWCTPLRGGNDYDYKTGPGTAVSVHF